MNDTVSHLLWKMYQESLSESQDYENQRYQLALLGLVNAFKLGTSQLGPAPQVNQFLSTKDTTD